MKVHPPILPFRHHPESGWRFSPVSRGIERTARLRPALAATLLALGLPAYGQSSPQITSFLPNGELTCIHLEPGSKATVEWSSTMKTGDWEDCTSLLADTNGVIQVTVPVSGTRGFYRVRGVPMPSIVLTATNLDVPESGSGNFGNRKSTRLNSSHAIPSRMPSSA